MQRVLKWGTGSILLAAVGVMALMAWWPAATGAQQSDDPPEAEEATGDTDCVISIHPGGGFAFGWPGAFHDADFVADVAAKLGIHADDLQAAIDEVARERRAAAIQDAVDAGRLTQEEADELLEAIEDDTFPAPVRRFHAPAFDLPDLGPGAAHERLEESLARAVEQGVMTQEQADRILEAIETGTLDAAFSLAVPFAEGERTERMRTRGFDRGERIPGDVHCEVIGAETESSEA